MANNKSKENSKASVLLHSIYDGMRAAWEIKNSEILYKMYEKYLDSIPEGKNAKKYRNWILNPEVLGSTELGESNKMLTFEEFEQNCRRNINSLGEDFVKKNPAVVKTLKQALANDYRVGQGLLKVLPAEDEPDYLYVVIKQIKEEALLCEKPSGEKITIIEQDYPNWIILHEPTTPTAPSQKKFSPVIKVKDCPYQQYPNVDCVRIKQLAKKAIDLIKEDFQYRSLDVLCSYLECTPEEIQAIGIEFVEQTPEISTPETGESRLLEEGTPERERNAEPNKDYADMER